MTLVETGSMASAPMARLGWSSALGTQVSPLSSDFQTAPAAAPQYILEGIVGSMAMQRMRPLLFPWLEPLPELNGAGPIGIQLQAPGTGREKKTMPPPGLSFGSKLVLRRSNSLRIVSTTPAGQLPLTRACLKARPL